MILTGCTKWMPEASTASYMNRESTDWNCIGFCILDWGSSVAGESKLNPISSRETCADALLVKLFLTGTGVS